MPSEESKKAAVIALGLDPEKFTLDDNYVAKPIVTESPTSTPIGVSAKPSYSAFGTAGRNAALGVIPAAAGAFAAGTVGGMELGPFAPLVGLAAAGVAGYGASKAQGAVMNVVPAGQEFLNQTAQANEEHPVAAVAGNLAAQLPFFRFNPKVLGDATRGALAGNIAKNPALVNTAIGTGIGAAAGLYDEVQDPADFNAARFGLNVAGGALLNDPRAHGLNAKMGLHPYETPASFDRYRGGVDMSMPPEVKAKPSISGADFARESKSQGDLNINSEKKLVSSQKRSDKMAGWEESDPILQKLEEERMAGEGNVAHEVKREVPENQYQNFNDLAAEKTREMQLDKIKEDFDAQQAISLKAKNDAKQAELDRYFKTNQEQQAAKDYNQLQADDLKTSLEAGQIPANEVGKVNPQKTNTKGVEQANIEAANESAADLEARRLEGHTGDKYQEDTGETKKSPTPEGLLKANVNLANQRGVDMTVSRTPLTSPEEKPVTGVADIANRKSVITGERPDTGFHEITHFTVADLEPKLKSRLLDRVSSDKKAQDWIAKEKAAGRNPDAEEYVAQAAGEDDLRRIKNHDQNLVRDLTAWAKVHISRNASSDDVVRFLTNKAIYDAPHENAGNISAKPVAPVTKAQDEKQTTVSPFQKIREEVIGKDTPQPTREESKAEAERVRLKDQQAGRYQDKEQKPVVSPEEREEAKTRYHENDKQLGAAIKSMNEPDIQRYWKIKEEIKNKYFQGHSPEGYELDKKAGRIKEQDKDQTDINIDTSRKGFLRAAEASFDSAERVHKPIAQAARDVKNDAGRYIGEANYAASQLEKFPREEVNRVKDLHREAYRNRKDELSETLTPEQQKISDALSGYYGYMGDERIKAGVLINGRKPGENKFYIPDQLSEQAIHTLINQAMSPQAKVIKNAWADHIVEESGGKITHEAALDDINAFVAAMGGKSNNYLSLKYGAIHRAAGYGLPESIREADAVKSLLRYGRRAANDLAFYKHIESKPDIAGALKIPDPNTGKIHPVENADAISQAQEVRDAMKWLTNSFSDVQNTPKFNAVVRLINNGIMGTATGIRDTASVFNNMLPYLHDFPSLSAAIKGISQWRQESTNALRTGAKQPHVDKIQFNEIMDSPDRVTSAIQKAATLLRKWQGREAIENFNRDITFSAGKELVRYNIIGAKSGNAKSKAFLDKFGDLVKGDVTTQTGAELEESLNQIAKNFVDRNQGTYDGRGLPVAAMEGSIAPFLSIQKWAIEKSNVIYKDVYKPFITGENRVPMLTYLLGSVMTGAAIQELNTLLTGRKSQDASVYETAEVPTATNIASELATLLQLGSYAGIVSDAVKVASDVALKGKTPRNIVSFPASTSIADLQERVANFSEAINQGSDPWEVAKEFTLDMLTHNIQGARMIANRTAGKDDIDRSDKFRDLRVFRELTGSPAGEPTKSNPYMDMENKKFKRSDDLAEAASYLPDIYEKFAEKASENPEKAMKFLANLKANSYQTMPSVESSPQEFVTYWNYLLDTQGEDKAIERLMDFYKQSGLNKAKSGMIP